MKVERYSKAWSPGNVVASREQQNASLVVGMFFLFAMLRIAISFELIDMTMHYTSEGGSILEKIHPASYGIIFVFGIIYLSWELVCDKRDRPIVTASLIVILVEIFITALSLATGRVRGLSFSLDSILEGPLIAYIMVFIDDRSRRSLFHLLIYALIFNDLVLFFEFATHIRIGIYAFADREIGDYFRPVAFLGHPLIDGAFNAAAVAFAWLMPWSLPKRAGLAFFFMLAAFAAQARISSILSVLVFLGSAWLVLRDLRQRKQIDEGAMVAFLAGTLMVMALALVGIAMSGLADRLLGLGLLTDKSSEARFQIYDIFHYLTWKEMIFGVDTDWGNYLINSVLGLNASESWIVNGVLYFGIIGSVVIFPALFFFIWRLQTNAKNGFVTLGVLCSLFIALEGNALTTKSPTLMFDTMIALSAIGALRADKEDARARYLKSRPVRSPRITGRPQAYHS